MAKVAKNKQMAVLNYIHKQVEDHGYPPTVREICSAVGLSSTSTVHGHISRLIEQGFLQKDPSKPRALEITSKGLDILGVKPIQKEIPPVPRLLEHVPDSRLEQPDMVQEIEGHRYYRRHPDLRNVRCSCSKRIHSGIRQKLEQY